MKSLVKQLKDETKLNLTKLIDKVQFITLSVKMLLPYRFMARITLSVKFYYVIGLWIYYVIRYILLRYRFILRYRLIFVTLSVYVTLYVTYYIISCNRRSIRSYQEFGAHFFEVLFLALTPMFRLHHGLFDI